MSEEKITLNLDAETLLHQLAMVDGKVKQTEEKANNVIEEINQKSELSFTRVLSMARNVYMAVGSIIRIGGGAISSYLNMAIGATFSTIAILKPLLTAEALIPGMAIPAAIGITQLISAIAAMGLAEQERLKTAQTLQDVTRTISSIGRILNFYFV